MNDRVLNLSSPWISTTKIVPGESLHLSFREIMRSLHQSRMFPAVIRPREHALFAVNDDKRYSTVTSVARRN